MTAAEPARGGALVRLLRRPWFAIVAGLVALVLVAAVAWVVVPRIFPPATVPELAEPVPSAFPVTLTPDSSPAVSRGETVSVRLQAALDGDVDAVEIWEDGALLIRVDDPPAVESGAGRLLDLPIDIVATTAGQHQLSARVIAADGGVGQSILLATAVLDLPADLGELDLTTPDATLLGGEWAFGGSDFLSVPGDTFESIAGRLAVAVDDLVLAAPLPAAAGDGVLPAGTRVFAPVVPPQIAGDRGNYRLPSSSWVPALSAQVDGCDVIVSSSGYTAEVALYSGPELRRVGQVAPESSVRIPGLPIGTSVIVGYQPGPRPETTAQNGPTSPIAVEVPAECAGEGWTGDLRVVNGVLLNAAESAVTAPYVYVSLDGGDWVRYPSAEDDYLAGGNLVDIHRAGYFPGASQINIELWDAGGGGARKVADGTYCLARIADPGTEDCVPPEVPPPVTTASSTTLELVGPGDPDHLVFPITPEAPATAAVLLDGDARLDLRARVDGASDADAVMLQYSFFPISPESPALSPPGVFHQTAVTLSGPAGARTASLSTRPWEWRNVRVDTDGDPAADGGALTLNDELTRSIAQQALLDAGGVVRDVYLRVVPVAYTGIANLQVIPVGDASGSIHVDMDSWYPEQGVISLAAPTISVEPGRVIPVEIHSAGEVYGNQCHTVQMMPEASTYDTTPYGAGGSIHHNPPGSTYLSYTYAGPPLPGDEWVRQPIPTWSDLAQAESFYDDLSWVYCVEGRAAAVDAARAAIKERALEAAECGVACVIQSVLIGALVGLAYGGPYGAIVGAVVGLAAGLTHALAPELYAELTKYWDAVAGIYNGIKEALVTLIDTLACQRLAEVSSAVAEGCKELGAAVLSAIAAYYGIPPSIPTSDQIERIAQSGLSGLIELTMGQFVDCDAMTVGPEAADLIREGAGATGSGVAQDATAAGTQPDGSISVCRALAEMAAGQAFRQLVIEHGQLMAASFQAPAIKGLVVEPYTDTAPRLRLNVPAAATDGDVTQCPVVVTPTLLGGSEALQLEPFTGLLERGTVMGIPLPWTADIPVPLPYFVATTPNPRATFADDIVGIGAAWEGQRRLTLDLSSPCFSSVYRVEVDGVNDATPAFDGWYVDGPTVMRYYPGYGFTGVL